MKLLFSKNISLKKMNTIIKKSLKKISKHQSPHVKKSLIKEQNKISKIIKDIDNLDMDNIKKEETTNNISPEKYIFIEKVVREFEKKKKVKERKNNCSSKNFMNCERDNNACKLVGIINKKCVYSDILQLKLDDCNKNQKKSLVCPLGTYTNHYRGRTYCSKYKEHMTHKDYINLFFDINPFIKNYGHIYHTIRPFKIIYGILKKIRYTGFYNYLRKTFKDSLKAILFGSLIAFQNQIIIFFCNNYYKTRRLFPSIKYSSKKMDRFLKSYQKNITNNFNKIESLVIPLSLHGAQEEIVFREYLQRILENNLKNPVEQSLKTLLSLFGKKSEIEQTINMIYLFIECTLNGIAFGLYHKIFSGDNNKEIYCMVFYTTVMGFQMDILQRYSNDISLCWKVHFFTNFHNSLTINDLNKV